MTGPAARPTTACRVTTTANAVFDPRLAAGQHRDLRRRQCDAVTIDSTLTITDRPHHAHRRDVSITAGIPSRLAHGELHRRRHQSGNIAASYDSVSQVLTLSGSEPSPITRQRCRIGDLQFQHVERRSDQWRRRSVAAPSAGRQRRHGQPPPRRPARSTSVHTAPTVTAGASVGVHRRQQYAGRRSTAR